MVKAPTSGEQIQKRCFSFLNPNPKEVEINILVNGKMEK
jgi:hypothetical protein